MSEVDDPVPREAQPRSMAPYRGVPTALLQTYVDSYWGFVRDLSGLRRFTVTPDRFLEAMFFVDPPYVETERGLQRLPACTLIPLLEAPLQIVTGGVVRFAAVRFHAWAAGIVFPQANVAGCAWYDIASVFPGRGVAIAEALLRVAWDDVAAIFNAMLLEAFANARPSAKGIAAARSFGSAPDDASRVVGRGDVAFSEGRSRRQVERDVRSLTNRSPKQLASLSRFQFVRDTLWAAPDAALGALAAEAGYADQAHLSREFRRYAAQSPSAFERDCLRLRAFLEERNVAFVQDEASTPG